MLRKFILHCKEWSGGGRLSHHFVVRFPEVHLARRPEHVVFFCAGVPWNDGEAE